MGTAVDLVRGGDLGGPPSTNALARGGNPEPARRGTQETAITPQKAHFGLPETITAVMPTTFYFSAVVDPSKDVMLYAQFRLTSMQDQMITNLSTPTAGGPYIKGFWNQMIPTINTFTWPTAGNEVQFPTTGSPDDSQWRGYYHKMYQYYRVLGIEYEFTIQNPQHNVGNDILMATMIDTYSLQSATNVHPLTSTTMTSEIEHWPDVRWHIVRSSQDGNQTTTYKTIKGHYKPGKVRQNVENDEDVSTWTKVGSSPDLTEKLILAFAKAPFNTNKVSTGVNIRCTLRKIVQYKDLHVPFRWPTENLTDIIFNIPTDIIQQ